MSGTLFLFGFCIRFGIGPMLYGDAARDRGDAHARLMWNFWAGAA